MISGLPTRSRYVLAKYGAVVAAVLLLTGTAALGTTMQSGPDGPETRVVTERTDVEGYQVQTDHSAVVTGNTSFWERGTTLRNRPVYLQAASPSLTLHTSASVPAERPVSVDQRVELHYRATHERRTVWRSNRTLVQRSGTTTNGTFRTNATIDVPQVASRRQAIRSELPAGSEVTVTVVVRTTYESERYDGVLVANGPLRLEEGVYSMPNPPSANRTHSRTVQRELPATSGNDGGGEPLSTGGLVGIAAVVAGGLVALGWHRSPPAAFYDHELQLVRYSDWISTGEVPATDGARVVTLDSLEGLVDVAIDSNKRVIHDTERNVYAVIDGDAVYWFRPATDVPPSDPLSGGLDSDSPGAGIAESADGGTSPSDANQSFDDGSDSAESFDFPHDSSSDDSPDTSKSNGG